MKDTIYLLTGAAGFLGSNITRELIARGKPLRALVLEQDPAAKSVPPEAALFHGDVSDKASLEAFFQTPQGMDVVVIHAASIVSLSPEPNRKVYDVNVTGTKHIVDLCVEHKVKKLVYVGSTGAISEAPNGAVIAEPEVFHPDEVVGYYSATKAIASNYVLETVKKTGLDASIVCPSGICGPNDYAYGPFASFLIKYCQGGMPVGVEGSFNSVDARDLAKGILSCADRGRRGELYIMSNEMVSMDRMFDLISRASGASRVKTMLTANQMRAMSVQKAGDSLDAAKRAMLEFELYNLIRNNNFSSEKARRELGYLTRPFEKTIADAVDWLAAEQKISKAA